MAASREGAQNWAQEKREAGAVFDSSQHVQRHHEREREIETAGKITIPHSYTHGAPQAYVHVFSHAEQRG